MTRILAHGTEHRHLASEWYDGQGSALYAYSSTGSILGYDRDPVNPGFGLVREIREARHHAHLYHQEDVDAFDEFEQYVLDRIGDSVWTVDALDIVVHVAYDGQSRHDHGVTWADDGRERWRYVLIHPLLADGVHAGNDIHSGVNATTGAREMAATLASFLETHAEALDRYHDDEHLLFPWGDSEISSDLAAVIRDALEGD